jgi:hypothetical protein
MPEETESIKALINQYGMPMIAAGGMAYFIYFVWKFVTENINSQLGEAKKTMIALIDRIRMLDNDLIRLEQKINTAIEIQRGEKPVVSRPAAETPKPINHETTASSTPPTTQQ